MSRFRDFFKLGEVIGYFFRRKDPNRMTNVNVRMMHGVNKFSIITFLIAIIVYLITRFIR